MVFKLKRPPTEWEKIFASYTSEKELIIRIYKKLKKLNSPTINEPIKKWATELKLTELFQGRSPNSQKTHEKMFTTPGQKEVQIKTTLRFHLTPVTPVKISSRTPTTTNVGVDLGKKEPSYTAGGNVS
jgi:hypothetical protein